MKRAVSVLRWILALPAAIFAGALIWYAASVGLDAFGVEFPDWKFFLVMAYTYMLVGFVFAGTATKLVPDRRSTVALLMIGVSLGLALLLVLRSEHGFAASLVFGLSLLAGAVGYSLRLRGFTDAVNADY